MPYLWHGLIASAFSFWKPITSITSLATDTFAINMNFWSGIIVLIFGIYLIIEALKFFAPQQEDKKSDFSHQLLALLTLSNERDKSVAIRSLDTL